MVVVCLHCLIFIFVCLYNKPRSQTVPQADLELMVSKDPPVSASPVAGTTGAHHSAHKALLRSLAQSVDQLIFKILIQSGNQIKMYAIYTQ